MTLYFHSLPIELEKKILRIAHTEHHYDCYVKATDERRVDIWKGHYSLLKRLANSNGIKIKGTKFIIDTLFAPGVNPTIIESDSLVTLIILRNLLIEWEKLPRGAVRKRCIYRFLDGVSKYIEFVKTIEKLHNTYTNKLVEFEQQGVNVDKYKSMTLITP